jgi:predicted DCC family thiol-disulfide oxidoreductase YuxK
MRTLRDHIILYDADCPMCKVYTRAFTHTGMLDRNGRASYQDMPEAACPLVDRQRAVNEIALVNTHTGEVSYGIESIFKVLGNALPLFKPLFGFAPFVWLMRKVYAFISYNRRVIIPAPHRQSGIQPTFRLSYRIAFLLFAWLVTSYILTMYAAHLTPLVPLGNAYREYMICGMQMLVQGAVISFYRPAKAWDYLGNMMTISMAGALLLSLVLFVGKLLPLNAVAATIAFMAVALLMFLEHIRRTKLLQLGWVLTFSWVMYRLVVLLLIYLYN